MENGLGAFVAALVLAAAYLMAGRLQSPEASKEFWERRRWISAAAGISVAYVFVDLLPELSSQQSAFARATENSVLRFVEVRMYALALASFVLFYGLDHMVLSKKERHEEAAFTEMDGAFWLHLIGFCAYSGLIGYLLVERVEKGWLALTAYTFVMAVHFLIIGHSLSEEEGPQQVRLRRGMLAASVLAGCLIGSTTQLSPVTLARLFAVLAGGVVITSLNNELPGDRRGRFWPFFCGAAVFASALLASEAAQA